MKRVYGVACEAWGGVGSGQACPGGKGGHFSGDPTGPSGSSPAEKRALLVKELRGLAPVQRDHMLRGMPLGLAEKRRLRSVPTPLAGGGPEGPRACAGWSPGGSWVPSWSRPDAASVHREETRTPRGKQRGRPRLPSCCSRLPHARVLVGAPGLGCHWGWGWVARRPGGGHPSCLCRPACVGPAPGSAPHHCPCTSTLVSHLCDCLRRPRATRGSGCCPGSVPCRPGTTP